MDPSSESVSGDSSSSAVDSLKMSSDLVSEAVRLCTEEFISEGANDTKVSDESQLLFLVDSESGEPCTIIRAFDINGNLVPSYSLVIPEDSHPVYAMGFTVIGSDLYMVGGHCTNESLYDSDYESDGLRPLPNGEVPMFDTKTFKVDLLAIPEALKSAPDLSLLMERGPRMEHSKNLPIVYAVNQTLYVLSRWVHSNDHSSFIDFESLDVGDFSSTAALPNPPLRYWDGHEPYYDHQPPYFRVGSHALVDGKSIVTSLDDRRVKGIYVFYIESSRWDCVDTDGKFHRFIGQPVVVSGLYYALSLSGSSLAVSETIPSVAGENVSIRGASELVRCYTSHYIAAIGNAIFIFRTGSPAKTYTGPVYLTIDKYEVSGDGHTIAEVGDTVSYLYTEATLTGFHLNSLFLQPVSLETLST